MFKYKPEWQGPLSGPSFEKQTEDFLNGIEARVDEIDTRQTPSDATPMAPGVGSAGTSDEYSRGDHVHPLQTSVSGSAGSAARLQTPRTISMSGEGSGMAAFDGSADITIPIAVSCTADGATEERPLTGFFGDVLTAKDFGAKGDGATNDTAAFASLESSVTGRFVNLCGASYVVNDIPKQNIYFNGTFIAGGETIPVQNCKLRVSNGELIGWGTIGQQYVFVGDIPSAFWRSDEYKNSGLISIGTGNFKNINAKTSTNIAIGNGVMSEGNPSNFNIGIGDFALHYVNGILSSSGDRNVALGSLALLGLNTGSFNVAIGRDAGQCVTSGSSNVIVGYQAMGDKGWCDADGNLYACAPITGSGNVAVGAYAANQLTGASAENIAIGHYAGRNLKETSENTLIGSSAFLYGEYNKSVNGKKYIDANIDGTYVQSGNTITVTMPGNSATAGGYVEIKFTSGELKSTTGGLLCFLYVDTVIDADSFTIAVPTLRDASGTCTATEFETSTSCSESVSQVVAIGASAGHYLRSGSHSTLIGYHCVYGSNEDGSDIVNSNVTGYEAASSCKTVTASDVLGYRAAKSASKTTYCVIVGNSALGSVSGEMSSAVSIGRNSGGSCTAANSCAFVGMSAGNRPASLSKCTAVGYTALYHASDTTALENSTAIGYNAQVTASNQVQLGNSDTTTYVYGSVQDRSDARDKTDIRDTILGLDFIKALHPVDFRWDYREDYIDYVEDGEELRAVEREKDGSRKRIRYHHGLIAQEVRAVLDEKGIDFGGYQDHSVNGGKDVLTLGYEEFIGPIIRSIQELNTRLEAVEVR